MRKYILALVLIAASTLYTQAQYRIGGVTIQPITLQEQGDSLYLQMDIQVDGTSMNKCQSWTIMPSLITADSTYVFDMPYALVNGKRKAQLYRRKISFENERLLSNLPYMQVDKIKGVRDITLRYVFTAPYEYWMDTASLYINQILTSCADNEQWFVLEGLAKVDLMPYTPQVITPKVNYITPEKEVKTKQLEGSAFLDFQVGRSVILPDFRRNPQELAKIDEVMRQVTSDKDFEISGMKVIGYASPEGTWESNNRLSKARAEALKQYIQNKFSIAAAMIEVDNVAEDWDGLVKMINEGEMAGKYRVLEIIAGTDIFDGRESQLMRLDGGRPYRYMLNEMFPSLRRVEYRVDFTVKEYSLEEAGAIMEKNPDQLNQYELFILAQSLPEGSPQRDRVYDQIMRMYPEDEVANINFAARMLEREEYGAAKRYLDVVGDDARQYNNLGVYYLLTGDLDEAERYFRKAVENGSEEAIYNLLETEKKREDNKIMERFQRNEALNTKQR